MGATVHPPIMAQVPEAGGEAAKALGDAGIVAGTTRTTATMTTTRRANSLGASRPMNGHVFDYTGERTPEKYIRTMKELVAHVGLTYKDYTTELKEGLERLSLVDPRNRITHLKEIKWHSRSGRWTSRNTARR